MDKAAIKRLIGWFAINYGNTRTIAMLDKLKSLGFQYATQAGISLGIDDLLVAHSKKWLLQDAEDQVASSERYYIQGKINAVERLRKLIDTWHSTSQYLKHEIVQTFIRTDPTNPVYMMAFSGARGNLSQVHQLVGMRGLMSDPQGQIIDLPIRSNFREGLGLTEYIISCYGARKGLVDTALRTADSGYLTRRLVDIAQELVISSSDCGTKAGFLLMALKENNKLFLSLEQRLVGRVLAYDIVKEGLVIAKRNQDVSNYLASQIVTTKLDIVAVRSPLGCISPRSLCQLCYGWSLAHGQLVGVGEAVGIIAAQSIGEPGTQLTMRTFHTGGVFTADIAEQIRSPFSGTIWFSHHLTYPTRTRHGEVASLSLEAIQIVLQGNKDIRLLNAPANTLILVKNGESVKARQVLAETLSQAPQATERAVKDVYSETSGEVLLKNFSFESKAYNTIETSGSTNRKLWILSGKVFSLPALCECSFQEKDQIFESSLLAQGYVRLAHSAILKAYGSASLSKIDRISGLYPFQFSNGLHKSTTSWIKLYHSAFIVDSFRLTVHNDPSQPKYFLEEIYPTSFLKKRFCLDVDEFSTVYHNQSLATWDDPEYRTFTGGKIIYGSLEVQTWENEEVFINSSVPTKLVQNRPNPTKYVITKGGTVFWISEETFESAADKAFLPLIRPNTKVQAGTEIAAGVFCRTSGLACFSGFQKDQGIQRIVIRTGEVYPINKCINISSKIGQLVAPGEQLFENKKAEQWVYMDTYQIPGQEPVLLIQPAQIYEIKKDLNTSYPLGWDSVRLSSQITLQPTKYITVADGESIKSNNGFSIVQVSLVLKMPKEHLSKQAQVTFCSLESNYTNHIYVQISLGSCLTAHSHPYSNVNFTGIQTRAHVRSKTSILPMSSFIQGNFLSDIKGIVRQQVKKANKERQVLILREFDQFSFVYKKNNESSFFNNLLKASQDFLNSQVFNKNLLKSKSLNSYVGFLGHLSQTDRKRLAISQSFDTRTVIHFGTKLECFVSHSTCFQLRIVESIHKRFGLLSKLTRLQNNSINWFHANDLPTVGSLYEQGETLPVGFAVMQASQLIGVYEHQLLFRKARPYLLYDWDQLRVQQGKLIQEGDPLITVIYQKPKTEDIIQGLPKIEELLEARKTKGMQPLIPNLHDLANSLFQAYHSRIGYQGIANLRSSQYLQWYLVNSVQRVYQSQGVTISDKHIEIIVKQMTRKVIVHRDKYGHLLPGELLQIYRISPIDSLSGVLLDYRPAIMGLTRASLTTHGFISAASFQETTRVLSRAALEKRTDWLRGLKENVVLGKLIPAGTAGEAHLEKRGQTIFKQKPTDFTGIQAHVSWQQLKTELGSSILPKEQIYASKPGSASWLPNRSMFKTINFVSNSIK
uniref:RNA polymerase beta'' subunit n=1 Tax=Streptofilum capillatum TaxID=2058781 RepID=UPI00286BDC6C|nr:RNA polymerase beta'' subunit [Streptofilum capillatum]WKT08501.1 RNA polymerase beta'' subunit [Streptofilum capillatum]